MVWSHLSSQIPSVRVSTTAWKTARRGVGVAFFPRAFASVFYGVHESILQRRNTLSSFLSSEAWATAWRQCGRAAQRGRDHNTGSSSVNQQSQGGHGHSPTCKAPVESRSGQTLEWLPANVCLSSTSASRGRYHPCSWLSH